MESELSEALACVLVIKSRIDIAGLQYGGGPDSHRRREDQGFEIT